MNSVRSMKVEREVLDQFRSNPANYQEIYESNLKDPWDVYYENVTRDEDYLNKTNQIGFDNQTVKNYILWGFKQVTKTFGDSVPDK